MFLNGTSRTNERMGEIDYLYSNPWLRQVRIWHSALQMTVWQETNRMGILMRRILCAGVLF
ncbi:MAG: hypothetical protein ACLUGQ_10380 [Coprococcus sp.]